VKEFNDDTHSEVLSEDGSFTAYSKEYDEHYHSTKDGALRESLVKHVIPAFSVVTKMQVSILDICYGLGFNTLATLRYIQENFPDKKINIYSPELDASLIKSLKNFTYPKEFEIFREIINALVEKNVYKDDKIYIELFVGDAREYVQRFENKFDIVYQDAFSPKSNPLLWTKEYFNDIKKAMKESGVLTTYSIALKTRLALHENNFFVYLNQGEGFRGATVASPQKLKLFEQVDVLHKSFCNPDIKSLRDSEI